MEEKTRTGSREAKVKATIAPSTSASSAQPSDEVQKMGAQVKAAAGDVVQEAKERAASLAGEVKDRTAAAAQEAKGGAADKLDNVAEALRSSGQHFQGHQDQIAQLIERGAVEIGDLAKTLRTNDLQGLLGKLGDLARRQLAVFVGVAMAAGFAAVRLGKVAVAGASQADLPKMPEVSRDPK